MIGKKVLVRHRHFVINLAFCDALGGWRTDEPDLKEREKSMIKKRGGAMASHRGCSTGVGNIGVTSRGKKTGKKRLCSGGQMEMIKQGFRS